MRSPSPVPPPDLPLRHGRRRRVLPRLASPECPPAEQARCEAPRSNSLPQTLAPFPKKRRIEKAADSASVATSLRLLSLSDGAASAPADVLQPWCAAETRWWTGSLALMRQYCRTLRHLWLPGCGLPDHVCASLVGNLDLPCNGALQTLDLSGNPLGESTVAALFQSPQGLSGNRELRALAMRRCELAELPRGLLVVAASRKARRLSWFVLDVRDNGLEPPHFGGSDFITLTAPSSPGASGVWRGIAQVLSADGGELRWSPGSRHKHHVLLDRLVYPRGTRLRKDPVDGCGVMCKYDHGKLEGQFILIDPGARLEVDAKRAPQNGFLPVLVGHYRGWVRMAALLTSVGLHVSQSPRLWAATFFLRIHPSGSERSSARVVDMVQAHLEAAEGGGEAAPAPVPGSPVKKPPRLKLAAQFV
eukprot:TRINITY_DN14326_c0_g1_i1.p1 TRINITY_DN14326_c0_g1~~TRINITY_DN14326_c0_g1_i1.p1  ORF type:complete len:444 (+),score=109.92 TRINITY_DN14326_c0_g1_i1:81-1334(+)